jgi:hypothetical protein
MEAINVIHSDRRLVYCFRTESKKHGLPLGKVSCSNLPAMSAFSVLRQHVDIYIRNSMFVFIFLRLKGLDYSD